MSKSLIHGVFMEAEVVGVRSTVANQLPKDAFHEMRSADY